MTPGGHLNRVKELLVFGLKKAFVTLTKRPLKAHKRIAIFVGQDAGVGPQWLPE